MKKSEAYEKKYCKHCAAFKNGLQLCGVGQGLGCDDCCRLPDDVALRWQAEHGLEGVQKREIRPVFGDRDLIKPRRGRKKR